MITRLLNKNYLNNIVPDGLIRKYKFIYLDHDNNENLYNIIYKRLGIIWSSEGSDIRIKYVYKDMQEFMNQFDIHEFKDIYEATEYIYDKNTINNYLNIENILYINKYQIYWDDFFLKSKDIFGDPFKIISTEYPSRTE